MRLLAGAGVLWGVVFMCTGGSAAGAQDQPPMPSQPDDAIVIVPALRDNADPVRARAMIVERIGSLANAPMIEDARIAGAAFEASHSSEATQIAASDVERWASASRTALRLLSRGDYDGARRALLAAQAISDRAAEALNRETLRARQVLDTCLYVVRAAIETGDALGADEQARRCRHLIPRMQASAYTHTPEVREIVARVDAELEAQHAGTLTIENQTSGCDVRINGVYFGTSPLTTSELGRGEYRVQVECDATRSGRIHRVTLGESDVRLRVHTSFDQSVRTGGGIALTYPDDARRRASLRADGAEVARTLGRPVWIVIPEASSWTFMRVLPSGRWTPSIQFDSTAGSESDARLAREMSASADDAGTWASDDARRGHTRRDVLAVTLLSVGGAALATASSLAALRSQRGDASVSTPHTSPDYLDNQDAYLRARSVALSASVGGAALGAVGVARLVRRSEHSTALAWVGGSVGLGLVAWATADALAAPVCIERPYCRSHDAHVDRAALLAAFATPALAMPIAAALPTSANVQAAVRVGQDFAVLELHGALR